MVTPKCQVCRQWNAQKKLTCTHCGVSYIACNSCVSKRSTTCSTCGWTAHWEITELEGTSSISSAPSASKIWQKSIEAVKKRREEEGATKHRGAELNEEDVII